ncbi:MAG: DUF4416 family protein [Proteobacteria bacterium]|nr:DUF4416 family protein [Desulfobacula sp.]MBU3954116.1 DUF4416 family protein [Pseudomonadota bacterium]MBU4130052.1 DUF4416 family protein [Pseudomonadota bacterium]
MSTPKAPDPAKLLISVFMKEQQVFEDIFDRLEQIAGPCDIISKWLDFDFTDYYYKEMGSPLYRRLIAFKPLIDQDMLADIKLATNDLEKSCLSGGNRQVNIDPGYLLASRFVLATGKEYSHRIYIGKNIYADLTLMYTKQGFKTLEWTYPDYASDAVTGFLEKVRNKYLLDLKERKDK